MRYSSGTDSSASDPINARALLRVEAIPQPFPYLQPFSHSQDFPQRQTLSHPPPWTARSLTHSSLINQRRSSTPSPELHVREWLDFDHDGEVESEADLHRNLHQNPGMRRISSERDRTFFDGASDGQSLTLSGRCAETGAHRAIFGDGGEMERGSRRVGGCEGKAVEGQPEASMYAASARANVDSGEVPPFFLRSGKSESERRDPAEWQPANRTAGADEHALRPLEQESSQNYTYSHIAEFCWAGLSRDMAAQVEWFSNCISCGRRPFVLFRSAFEQAWRFERELGLVLRDGEHGKELIKELLTETIIEGELERKQDLRGFGAVGTGGKEGI